MPSLLPYIGPNLKAPPLKKAHSYKNKYPNPNTLNLTNLSLSNKKLPSVFHTKPKGNVSVVVLNGVIALHDHDDSDYDEVMSDVVPHLKSDKSVVAFYKMKAKWIAMNKAFSYFTRQSTLLAKYRDIKTSEIKILKAKLERMKRDKKKLKDENKELKSTKADLVTKVKSLSGGYQRPACVIQGDGCDGNACMALMLCGHQVACKPCFDGGMAQHPPSACYICRQDIDSDIWDSFFCKVIN